MDKFHVKHRQRPDRGKTSEKGFFATLARVSRKSVIFSTIIKNRRSTYTSPVAWWLLISHRIWTKEDDWFTTKNPHLLLYTTNELLSADFLIFWENLFLARSNMFPLFHMKHLEEKITFYKTEVSLPNDSAIFEIWLKIYLNKNCIRAIWLFADRGILCYYKLSTLFVKLYV